jgi:hypothetical protein
MGGFLSALLCDVENERRVETGETLALQLGALDSDLMSDRRKNQLVTTNVDVVMVIRCPRSKCARTTSIRSEYSIAQSVVSRQTQSRSWNIEA